MERKSRRAVSTALAACLAIALATGCARTSVQGVQVLASDLPRPTMIVVYPFVTSGATVALNSGLLSKLREAVQATPEDQERENVARHVTEIVAHTLAKRRQRRGSRPGAALDARRVRGARLA